MNAPWDEKDKTLVIMRGLSWTGKSFRAKQILEESKVGGLILSTDDYWYQVNYPDKPEEYSFNRNYLSGAHKWNQLRAQRAIDMGEKLVIIDNTNSRMTDFCCDYMKYAYFQGYKFRIEEPTSERWLEIKELLRYKKANEKVLKDWAQKLSEGGKDKHNVPFFIIEKMMWRWELDLVPEQVIEKCLQH